MGSFIEAKQTGKQSTVQILLLEVKKNKNG